MRRAINVIQDVKRIYLCTPDLAPVTVLNGINTESVEYEEHLKDYSELHFEVARYISLDNGSVIESNGYEDIRVMMYLYLEDIGYFQIQEPETVYDGNYEYKDVMAYSIEKEFEQKDWLGLRINTGDSDSLEQLAENNLNDLGFAKQFVSFYNPRKTDLSFVHLMLTKMPGWTIGYIDEKLWYNIVPRIDLTNTNLYAVMTNEVAPRMSCIFIFDFLNKQVNAYHQSDIDFDTNIFIGFRNLAQEVEISIDEDSVYTQFRVRGDNDLSVRDANFGSDQVFDISYFIGKPWMTDGLAQKVRHWLNEREANRDDYIQYAREAAKINEQLYELKYRVPSDETYWRQWDNMNEEGLRENQKLFEAQLELLQVSVDPNPQYTSDGDYIPKKIGLEVDHDWYLDLLHESENGYGGYYTYIEIITYILPYISTAISNAHTEPENKTKYGNESAENWSLYGYIELDAKRKNYEEDKLPALEKYRLSWSQLSDDQKTAYVNEEGYMAAGRSEYLHVQEMLGSKSDPDSTPGSIYYYLDKLKKEIDILEQNLEDVESEMTTISEYVSIDGNSNTFNDSEKKLITTLLVDTDYTNSNILTTSIDTVSTTIDHEIELYEDAVEKLSEVAQPQYSFKVDLDNLLRIPQFSGWVEDLRLLRFIRVGIRDDYSVKLRVVGIKYNPCEVTPDLELEFSSMITSKSGRSDLTDIINNANNRGSKNSITIGTGKSSSESEYLTSLLQAMTKSGLFKNSIANIVADLPVNLDETEVNNIIAAYLMNTTIDVDHITGDYNISLDVHELTTELLKAESAEFGQVIAQYLDSEYVTARVQDIQHGNFETLTANLLDANTGYFETLMTRFLQSTTSTAVDQIADNQVIRNQIIANLSVGDLRAGDIKLTGDMRILSGGNDSDGYKIIMDNRAFQVLDDNNNVAIQLGIDASENPSLILRNENGDVILTPGGITEYAIGNQLIVNNMIHDNTISEDKLNFAVLKDGDSISIQNIYTEAGDKFGSEWVTYKQSVDTMVTDAVSKTLVYYYSSTSKDEQPDEYANWTTTPSTLDYSDGHYIWSKNVIQYVDGHTIETDPVMITGNDGRQGVGISSITSYYLASSLDHGITVRSRGWERAPQTTTPDERYLWSYQLITYTNGDQENTEPAIIGVYGDSGQDGRSVVSFSAIYHRSSSNDPAEITPPSMPKTYLTVSEGRIYTTHIGNPGIVGEATVGSCIVADENATSGSTENFEEYLISGSSDSWYYIAPEWVEGTYLWVCFEVIYNDGTIEYTTPFCDDSWESARAIAQDAVNDFRVEFNSTIQGVSDIADELNGIIDSKVWQHDVVSTINNLNIGGINLCDLNTLYTYKNGILTQVPENSANITKTGSQIVISANPNDYLGFKVDTSNVEVQDAFKIIVIDGFYHYVYSSSETEPSESEFDDVYVAFQAYDDSDNIVATDSIRPVLFDDDSDRFAVVLSVPSSTSYINMGVGQNPYSHSYELCAISARDESMFDAVTYVRDRLQEQKITLDEISSFVGDMSTEGSTYSEVVQKANMISWIVSGDSSSTMELTQNFIDLVSDNIHITGTVSFDSLDEKSQHMLLSGLIMKVNYSAFNTITNGDCYIHGYDSSTRLPADVDGYVSWNGDIITIPKTHIIPSSKCPGFQTVYIVGRIDSQNQTTANVEMIWYDDQDSQNHWKRVTASDTLEPWAWVEATDIVLGYFVKPEGTNALSEGSLYNPPRKASEIMTKGGKNPYQYSSEAVIWYGQHSAEYSDAIDLLDSWSQYDAVTSTTKINGGLIAAHTVVADSIAVDNLGAIKADMGTITAGILKSNNYNYPQGSTSKFSNAGFIIDLNNNLIRSKNYTIDGDGNAYFKGNISTNSGVTVYNNSDPQHPRKLAHYGDTVQFYSPVIDEHGDPVYDSTTHEHEVDLAAEFSQTGLVMTKGSININNAFIVNEYGGVDITYKQEDLSLTNKLFRVRRDDGNGSFTEFISVDNSGNLKINADSIEITSGDIYDQIDGQVNTQIEDIQIVGLNILDNSSFTDSINGFDGWTRTGHGIVTEDGELCGHITGVANINRILSQSIFDKIKEDYDEQIYTVSADIKVVDYAAGTTNPYLGFYMDGTYNNNGDSDTMTAIDLGGTTTTTNDFSQFSGQGWIRVVYTFKFPHKPTSMKFNIYCRDCTGHLYFKKVKLERGKHATDWDYISQDLYNLATVVTQNNNSLTTKIVTGDLTTMTRVYNNGVLIGKVGQQICAHVNASGSFDIVNVSWNYDQPTIVATYASFGAMNMIGSSADYDLQGNRINLCLGTLNGSSIIFTTGSSNRYLTSRTYSYSSYGKTKLQNSAVGDEVTLSFNWRKTGNSTSGDITPYISGYAPSNSQVSFTSGTVNGFYKKTFNLTQNQISMLDTQGVYIIVHEASNKSATVDIYNLKLEIGTNTQPVWTKSPEDDLAWYGSCGNTAYTVSKTVTIYSSTPFILSEGITVNVRFKNINSADNPTLNVAGTGQYPIHVNGNALTKSFSPWNAEDTVTLIFNGTAWCVSGQMNINAGNINAGTLNAVTVIAQKDSNLAGWIVSDNQDSVYQTVQESALRSPWQTIGSYKYQTALKTTYDSTHGTIFIKKMPKNSNDESQAVYPFWVKLDGSAFSTNPTWQWQYGNSESNYIQLRKAGTSESFGLGLARYSNGNTIPEQIYTLINSNGKFTTYLDHTGSNPILRAQSGATIDTNHSFVFGSIVFINVRLTGVTQNQGSNYLALTVRSEYHPKSQVVLSGYAPTLEVPVMNFFNLTQNTQTPYKGIYLQPQRTNLSNAMVDIIGFYSLDTGA